MGENEILSAYGPGSEINDDVSENFSIHLKECLESLDFNVYNYQVNR